VPPAFLDREFESTTAWPSTLQDGKLHK